MTTLDQVLEIREIEELTANVQEFQARRDHVLQVAHLRSGSLEGLSSSAGELNINFGTPPFLVSDGSDAYYAVIFDDSDVRPLPYGYELDPDDLNEECNANWSHIGLGGMLCYTSLRPDFEHPDDDEFHLERLCDEWEENKYSLDGLDYVDERWFDAETGEPYTGIATAKWPNGKLKKKAHLTDGMLDGKMTWWYENGQKELEDDYRNNRRHGQHRAWYENGELRAEGSSVDGEREGTWRWWHENGQLSEETEYKDGLGHGKHEKWHVNGKRALLTTFEEGEEQGLHKEWYESGQLEAIFPVVDGEVHGTVQLWDEDGTQYEDVEFFEGEKVTSTDEEVTDEEIEDLKGRIMELVETEERQEEAQRLIEIMEDRADGDLEQIAEGLQAVVNQLETALETAHSVIDAEEDPLVNATVEGDVKEIRRLLKEGATADVGTPAFVYAIVADQPKAFEAFVKHGIDVSKQFDWDNGDGSILPDVNAFILAAGLGNTWAVKRLLDLGADPNQETSGEQTPLRMAITNGQDEVVDLLFDKMPDVSTPSAGRVLVAAARAENAGLVERCLEAGVDVNATDASGWTALKTAVNTQEYEMAELLVQHGADCNIADDEDWTPLLNAIENRDLDLVDLLLSNGANPNAAPETQDDDDSCGFSAMMRAAHYGETKILKALIAAGADVAQEDSDGFAAVHYAASHRHPECLQILLNHGANPNAKSAEGQTPIGMFLLNLFEPLMEGHGEIDEEKAIKTLQVLANNGGSWLDAVREKSFDVAGSTYTAGELSLMAVKKFGLKKLSKEISRVSENAWITDKNPWRVATRKGDYKAIRDLLSSHVPVENDKNLYHALTIAIAILLISDEKYRLFSKKIQGFREQHPSAANYRLAIEEICRDLINAGARLSAKSMADTKILESLSADENNAALARAAIDDPVAWAEKCAKDAWEKLRESRDAYSRRDFHATAIDTLEHLLSVVKSGDTGTLDDEEVDTFTAILASVYTDDWDVDNAFRHVAALRSHDYCPDCSGPGLPEFDHFQFIESLSKLTERLSAAGRDNEAREVFDYLKEIYQRAELEYEPYIDKPANILAGKKKLRIILKHPRQAANALALNLIDKKKHEQLLQRFEQQQKANTEA